MACFFAPILKICYTDHQNIIMGESIMKKGDKIGIVACSNGLKESSRPEMEQLKITLESLGLTPFFSEYLYAKDGAERNTAAAGGGADEILPGRGDQRDL